MNQVHKVASISTNMNSVFKDIQAYLLDMRAFSQNTETAYEMDIRQFFKFMRNKDIEDLIETDLHFTNSDMKMYRSYLQNDFVQSSGKKYSNNTINRKMNTIVSLYKSLRQNEYNVDPLKLKLKDLPDTSRPIGFLSPNEIEEMIERLKFHKQGKQKQMIWKLAYRTSLRKNALLKLTWDDIIPHPEKDNYYMIITFDKGKQVEKDIHEKIYNELLELKAENKKIFTLGERTVDQTFDKLCREMDIPEYRNVSFHSLKKGGGQWVHEATNGDMSAVASQNSHSNIQTSYKHYTKKPRNLAATMDEDISDVVFHELDRDELLKLVVSFNTNGFGRQLREAAQKIIDARK